MRGGSAERIPLPDGAVDVVVVGQAWHWFDAVAATAEIARVLRPGGSLGLIWNVRDQREDWVRRFVELVVVPGGHGEDIYDPEVGHPFGPLRQFDVEWSFELPRADLQQLAASRSEVIALPDDERAAVLRRVADLADTHPALAGADVIRLPYITRTYTTSLRR